MGQVDQPFQTQRHYFDKQFDFGVALKLLKSGLRVHRTGWNGRGMWVCYQKGYPSGIGINENTAEATGYAEGSVCVFLPYLLMKTAAIETTFTQWTPSMTDILAEDWMVFFGE